MLGFVLLKLIVIFADGMKKRVNILFLAFATAVLLVLAIIPHHHHQGFWCNAVELCVVDKGVNDEHTHHSDDHTSCVEHLNFVATKYVVAKQYEQQSQVLHWLSWATITVQGVCKFAENETKLECNHTYTYNLCPTHDSNALRAPPVA